MKIIAYRADQTKPAMEELPNELHAMKDFVGGYIEVVSLKPNIALRIVCDEEGKLKNRTCEWYIDYGNGHREALAGDFFVCRFDGKEDLTSIKDTDLDYIQRWVKPLYRKTAYKEMIDKYAKEFNKQ